MKKNISSNPDKFTKEELQKRAEDHVLGISGGELAPLLTELDLASPEAMRRIVHQLQVHQIELEMQNEELRSTQFEEPVNTSV